MGKGLRLLFVWLLLTPVAANLSGQPNRIIQTVAGTGTPGFSGDNGPAVEAKLNSPSAVAADAVGNIYIADTRNHRVRRVGADGTISTIAGTGTPGFSGDGGPAVNAQLNQPLGVAVDVIGNVYIADTLNSRVRKVDIVGRISTVAGTGSPGFGGDGGPAVQAMLSRPVGLAIGSFGSLYIADVDNNRIRKVDFTGRITTVAGSGEPRFGGDGGPATEARLTRPRDVAVDGLENIYIADTDNHRVRRVNPHGIISTVAGTGEAGFSGDGQAAAQARLNFPRGVAVDIFGRLYIADMFNSRIRRVNRQGVISTIVGNGQAGFSGDGGAALQARLNLPRDLHVTPFGAMYIADLDNHRIRVVR